MPEAKVPDDWRSLLCDQIPGYDPIATAEPGDFFDPGLANGALDFFQQKLTLSKDSAFTQAGTRFVLQRWQASIVANLFGWQRLDEKGKPLRRYREAFIAIPRKNGKTELVAGLGCLGFFWDPEVGSEVYVAAKNKKQAAVLFGAAKLMVLRNADLKSMCQVYRSAITRPEDNSTFQAISKDAGGAHGTSPHIAIVDELHVQPDGELVEALESGLGARREPMFISLTTSDHDRADSICNEMWDYARRVRDGIQKESRFFPAIWEADPKTDDWLDEEVWRRVNPNLDVSLSMEFLRGAARKAQSLPRLRLSFQRLHLNMRTGAATEWLPMERWDECGGAEFHALERQLAGRKCWAGLDLAQRHDLAALVLVFPEEDDAGLARYSVLPYFFLPEEEITAGDGSRLDQRKRGLYRQWADEGLLELTPGDVIDYGRIHRRVLELRSKYNLRQVAADEWNAAKTAQDLQAEGIEVVYVPPYFKHMSAPSKLLEELVSARRLQHGAHPILRDHARVCMVDEDHADNIRPSKKRSGDKIDGVVAMIMGMALAQLGQGGDSESVYEERGMLDLWGDDDE